MMIMLPAARQHQDLHPSRLHAHTHTGVRLWRQRWTSCSSSNLCQVQFTSVLAGTAAARCCLPRVCAVPLQVWAVPRVRGLVREHSVGGGAAAAAAPGRVRPHRRRGEQRRRPGRARLRVHAANVPHQPRCVRCAGRSLPDSHPVSVRPRHVAVQVERGQRLLAAWLVTAAAGDGARCRVMRQQPQHRRGALHEYACVVLVWLAMAVC